MNEIILEISAFGISLFCFVDCLRNRSALYLPPPKEWINRLRNPHFLYLSLLISLMVSALTSVIQAGIERYTSYKGMVLSYILMELYFIFHTALAFLFTMYIISVNGAAKDKGRSFYVPIVVPMIAAELLVIINPLTRLIFYISDEAVYTRGSFMWLLYVLTAFYVLFGIAFFIINRRRIPRFDRVAVFILMFIAALGIAIQGVFLVTVELFFEATAFLGFMLLFEDEEYRNKSGRKRRISRKIIVVIAMIFFAVAVMNINLIYHAGTDQTEKIGEAKTDNLKAELQQSISESERDILRYSMGLEQQINENDDPDALAKYIELQQDYYSEASDGVCFSVYAASDDWTIIPGFDFGEDYQATKRLWYTGAAANPGQPYISEPYIDADTGALCYTFSYMLSDGKTVAAMDYSLLTVQDIVSRMGNGEEQFAMIVTDEGVIVGCSDPDMQGENIRKSLPEYADVFERIKSSVTRRSFTEKINDKTRIIFSSGTSNGWILILAVDYGYFYADIINQMILLGAIDFLMVAVIIVFYMVSVNSQEKAENTLSATENFIVSLSDDLRNPLNEILRISASLKEKDAPPDAVKGIREAGTLLNEKMDNLFSYSKILKADVTEDAETYRKRHRKLSESSRFTRNGIIAILIVALAVGLTLGLIVTTRWGIIRITNEADRYDGEVTQWMQQKRTILGMFADVIAADPHVLDDYDGAVKWLDDIACNYDEMTVVYLANPYNKDHQIIMNNGWVPGPGFVVSAREWYIATMRSGVGFNISAPYYDAQTGIYCITFSRSVYTKDGRFVGVFGIDCLLDKIIDVLDDSYTDNSYAFMVDRYGTIINHPNKDYEISEENHVNIEDTEYADAYDKGGMFLMNDYDGKLVSCYCKKSSMSGFTVVVVQNWWSVYGTILAMGMAFILLIVISIVAVVAMINRFIRWQEDTNEKLVVAAETAVAGEKAKSRFLAQMSHEIRTPINAVLGMNEMILRESDDKTTLEYAANIRTAGKTLLGLINSILDFSKIEEGKMEIIPVRYDTSVMIENMVNSVSERAKDKGLELKVHVDPRLPSVLYGDDMRLTQVVVNLLTNAVKYTKTGSVELSVNGEDTDSGNILMRICVSDTGIGIKEEDIGRLFDSFTRLEETRNRNIEGTGLGMAIVNRLLEMMDSKLEVSSVYGEGSRFSFLIRQKIVDAEPIGDYSERAKQVIMGEDEDTYVYAPEAKLLVVDDNKMNIIVIKNLLKMNGITPDTAMSGAEALDMMSKNKYHIVMLDHMMPEMDGIETLQKAKEDGIIDENCKTIALTANAIVGAREEYLDAGFDDYLSKPVDVKELEGQLARFLPGSLVSYRKRYKHVYDK